MFLGLQVVILREMAKKKDLTNILFYSYIQLHKLGEIHERYDKR